MKAQGLPPMPRSGADKKAKDQTSRTSDRAGDARAEDGPQASVPAHPGGARQFLGEHRRAIVAMVIVVLAIIFVFVVLPQLAGFGKSLHRLRYGNKLWLAAGAGLECISLFGYMMVFKTVFSYDGVRIGWRSAGQITLAGTVATKLLGAGGAGGIALTVWALRAAGHSAHTIAHRWMSFEMLLYSVFMAALIIFGGGIAIGALPGPHKPPLTELPAAVGASVILLVATVGYAAEGVRRWLLALAKRSKRRSALFEKLSSVPQTLHDGVRNAWEILHQPKLGHAGAIVYWAFDIATLWAAFHAFGAAPQIPVVVLAYFVGQMASVLPIPGGIGSVEGGMLGIFIAFGVSGSTAALAVIAYSLISIWLPVLPGSVAYFRLRAAVSGWREE
jgi:putative heme transporter